MKKCKKILLWICGGVFTLFIAAGASFAVITKDAVLDEEKLTLSCDEIVILDCANAAVKTLSVGGKKREFPVSALPEHVKNAFIDTEDKRFYKHCGIDAKRILRATWNNLISRSFKEGASTISQQLVKNTHLTQEKTIERKLKELKLTFALENKYSKDEILEKYLSSIYFGHNCFGIKSAAEFYFSKSPDELSLSEGATLAGLVKSPNNYSPFKNPEKCKTRRNAVLHAMLREGHITKREKEEAENSPLPQKTTEAYTAAESAESYYARTYDEFERIADEKGLRLKGTIRIYTYFSQDEQNTLSRLLSDSTKGKDEKVSSQEKSDAVATVLDNESGGFSAYFSTCGDCKRSPASLIKPIGVYAPAFEEGLLCPATPICDEPTSFSEYEPKNYAEKYYGYVSARQAIAKSLNVPAVKTLNALTTEKCKVYLSALQLLSNDEDLTLAAALGGFEQGFTLPQLTTAYSVFSRGGAYLPSAFIRKIEIEGITVYDSFKERKAAERQVFSDATATLTTDCLKTCVKEGTAKKLRALPFEIAAKTGTNGDERGNTDAYALAYTAEKTAAVWLGNADNKKIRASGGGLPCNILYEFFKNLPITKTSFPKSANVATVTLDKDDYEVNRRLTLADPLSPKGYTLCELFDCSKLPKERSTKFSSPQISMPTIAYASGKISIKLPALAPDYYEYLVERAENGKVTTVYKGKKQNVFIDSVEEGKSYEYSVTPIYANHAGERVILPKITTKSGDLFEITPTKPPNIVNEDWWNF